MPAGLNKTLRHLAGALLFAGGLAGCAPMSPIHTGGQPSHPAALAELGQKALPQLRQNGLRVLLRRGEKNLKLSAPGGLQLCQAESGEVLAELEPGRKGSIFAEASRVVVSGRRLPEALIWLKSRQGVTIKVGGVAYRGRLLLRAVDDDLLLINQVSLDEYLYGVLPSEVSPEWPYEALKAQAIAARTYAISRAGAARAAWYDVDDSTRSQVYSGKSREHPRASDAVDATSGQVLTWQGTAAETYFHSNCGGHTASAEEVWGQVIPYLQGVNDPYCENGKHYLWRATLSHDESIRAMRKAGKAISDFESLKGISATRSGRWREIEALGADQPARIKTSAFRQAIGADAIRSTRFEISNLNGQVVFEGRGWGHGVGLCQEGAQAMALEGYRTKDILKLYFPGTRLKQITE